MDVHERLPGQLGGEVSRRLRLDLSQDSGLHGSLQRRIGTGVETRVSRAGCLRVTGVCVVPCLGLDRDVVRHFRNRNGLEDEVLHDLDLAVDLVTNMLLGLDLDLVPADAVVVPAVRALDEHLPSRVGLPVPDFLTRRVVVGRPEGHPLVDADLVTLPLSLGSSVGLDSRHDLNGRVDVHAVDSDHLG